jgi:hypothetical protein
MEGDSIKTTMQPSTFVRESCDDLNLWWQPDEVVAIRKSAANVSLLVKEHDRKFGNRRNIPSYIETISQVYTTTSKGRVLARALFDDLTFWTSHGHSRRGLEKSILDATMKYQMSPRKNIVVAVRYMQEKCSEMGMKDDERMRLIRKTSKRLSKPATEIARVMGIADMLAVTATNQILECMISIPENAETYPSDQAVNDITRSSMIPLRPRFVTNRSA